MREDLGFLSPNRRIEEIVRETRKKDGDIHTQAETQTGEQLITMLYTLSDPPSLTRHSEPSQQPLPPRPQAHHRMQAIGLHDWAYEPRRRSLSSLEGVAS